MKDAYCLVTGATSGIGLATAIGLSRQGAHVGIVARTAQRGKIARNLIEDATGRPVFVFVGDLSSQATYDRELAGRLWEVSTELCGLPAEAKAATLSRVP